MEIVIIHEPPSLVETKHVTSTGPSYTYTSTCTYTFTETYTSTDADADTDTYTCCELKQICLHVECQFTAAISKKSRKRHTRI